MRNHRMRPKTGHAALAALVTLAAVLLLGAKAIAIETLSYETIARDGDMELRDYPAHVVVETQSEGDLHQASGEAFGKLFRYIRGANVSGRKLAMTAPVLTEPLQTSMPDDGPGKYRTAFCIPVELAASAPIPASPDLLLRAVPPTRMAAIRYSGTWSQSLYEEKLQTLRSWMRAKDLPSSGLPILARYDPPFKPWFLRRNEVLIPTARP